MKNLSKMIFIITFILLLPFHFLYASSMGFIKDGDTYTSIFYPGATDTRATNISTSGTIVGYYLDVNGIQHGFVNNGDSWISFDYPGATTTFAYDINDAGQIVGMYLDEGIGGVAGSAWHSFIKYGDSYTQFNYPGAYSNFGTYLYSINNSDQMVGGYFTQPSNPVDFHAFIPGGSFDISGAYNTLATGISDDGKIVGYYASWDDGGQAHGFLISGTDIVSLGFPYTHPLEINDAGQIVGYYPSFSYVGNGVTYGIISYPDYYIDGLGEFDVSLTYASGINNAGKIVGYYDYRFIPVTEPATMLLLGSGLLGLWGFRKKFKR